MCPYKQRLVTPSNVLTKLRSDLLYMQSLTTVKYSSWNLKGYHNIMRNITTTDVLMQTSSGTSFNIPIEYGQRMTRKICSDMWRCEVRLDARPERV
jgi:hypothetical protein